MLNVSIKVDNHKISVQLIIDFIDKNGDDYQGRENKEFHNQANNLCRIVNKSVGQWDQIHESVITGDNTQLQKGS